MQYKGKLYGQLGGIYFDTGKTDDDWDALVKRVAELEVENQALRQPLVIGSLPCSHNFIQKDTYWKSCTHCGMLAPLRQ